MDAFENFDMAVKVEQAVNSVNVLETSVPSLARNLAPLPPTVSPSVPSVPGPTLVPLVESVQVPKYNSLRGIRLPPLVPKKAPLLKMDVKVESVPDMDVKVLEKIEKVDTNTLKLKPLSSWKNTTAYKALLIFFAFVVFLYLSKKYWWNYVVKRFFPSDAKKDEKSESSGVITKTDHIADIKEKDVKSALSASDHAKVILIYATWCAHCKTMMKDFEEAAAHVAHAKLKNKVLFLRAEAGECPSIANRPSVPGFPTIVGIFQNGTEFPYAGPRTKDSFVKFAELIAIGGLDVSASPVAPAANGTGLTDVTGEVQPPLQPRPKPRKLTSFYESVPTTPVEVPHDVVPTLLPEVLLTHEEGLTRVPTATEDLDDKDVGKDVKDVKDVKDETVIETPLASTTLTEGGKETVETFDQAKMAEEDHSVLPNTPLQSTSTVDTHSRTRKSKKEIKL